MTKNITTLPIVFNELEWKETATSFYAKQGIWSISIETTNEVNIVKVDVCMQTDPTSILVYGNSEPCHPYIIEYKIHELIFKTLGGYMKHIDPEKTIREKVQKTVNKNMVRNVLNGIT